MSSAHPSEYQRPALPPLLRTSLALAQAAGHGPGAAVGAMSRQHHHSGFLLRPQGMLLSRPSELPLGFLLLPFPWAASSACLRLM